MKALTELSLQIPKSEKTVAVANVEGGRRRRSHAFGTSSAHCYWRTVSTGQVAVDTTLPATLPMNNLDSPVRP